MSLDRLAGAPRVRPAALLALLTTLLGVACGADDAPPAPEAPQVLAVGEQREVELRALRFEVSNFEQTLTLDDLRDLPPGVRDRLWLLDLDLVGGPSAPGLLDNALVALREADPDAMEPAARNLQRLLAMTPANADLRGTLLEPLVELSPLVGLPPARVLADLLGIDLDDPFLSDELLADVLVTNVIRTHPATRTRPGPVTDEHPDGQVPVPPGAIPITLADAVDNFASLAERFGPSREPGAMHPGFLAGDVAAEVFTDDFAMTVRANANALPYRGVELRTASPASVGSIASQIDRLFDFEDPDWLRIEGLVPGQPVLRRMALQVLEHDGFVPGGTSPEPRPFGNSPGWSLPAWTLERILLDAALLAWKDHSTALAWGEPGEDGLPLFAAEVASGWVEMQTRGGVGNPPAPAWLWDILLEVAQVRLHDGGIPQGEAHVRIVLEDIPIGLTSEDIVRTIRENLAADPALLTDVVRQLIDHSEGDADFYYLRPGPGTPAALEGDWLVFVGEEDIRRDDAGEPVRAWTYSRPGFFADEALEQRVSSPVLLEGDARRQKVRVAPGDTLYAQAADDGVHRIRVREKPAVHRLRLEITRVR